MKDNTAKAALCAILGNMIWGFSFLFTNIGLALAPSPSVMLAHRFTFSVLFMLFPIVTGKIRLSFRGKNLKLFAILVTMQPCYYLFESYGLLHTNSTIAGLVMAVLPLVTIGTGAVFLREYPTKRQALFCIMPVVGVILITVSGKDLGIITPLGILFLLLALLASSTYKTANRKVAEQFSAFERTFMVLTVSSLMFSIAGLSKVNWSVSAFVAPLLKTRYLFSVLGLSLLCSIVANLLVNYASGKMSVFRVSSFGAFSTLCSVFAGVVFLQEPMNWTLMLGAILILIGIRQVTKPQ